MDPSVRVGAAAMPHGIGQCLPPEQLRETFEVKPTHRKGCGALLQGDDPDPLRHQVAEIPPVRPDVDEYRLHRLTCSCCGTTTRAEVPAGVPTGPFGLDLTNTTLTDAGLNELMGLKSLQILAVINSNGKK